MRLTKRKKEILALFERDSLEWVTTEIGAPPFDVSGVAYMLHGSESFSKKSIIESVRRTLESMVADGLLEKIPSFETRQNKHQSSAQSPGVRCVVSRYGLPGEHRITKYQDAGSDYIDGEFTRIS